MLVKQESVDVACYTFTKKHNNRLFTFRKQFREEGQDFDRLDFLHGVSDASGNIEFFLVAATHPVREVDGEAVDRSDEESVARKLELIIEEPAASFLVHQPREEHAVLLRRKDLLVAWHQSDLPCSSFCSLRTFSSSSILRSNTANSSSIVWPERYPSSLCSLLVRLQNPTNKSSTPNICSRPAYIEASWIVS